MGVTMLTRSSGVVEGGSDFDGRHGRPGGLRCAVLEAVEGRRGELLRAPKEVAEFPEERTLLRRSSGVIGDR